MTKALPGEHLCVAHQGNHSHYAEHNCTICKLIAENAVLRADAEKQRQYRWRQSAMRLSRTSPIPPPSNG